MTTTQENAKRAKGEGSLPNLVSRCIVYQGCNVIIKWTRPEDDWPSYRVIQVDSHRDRVRLKGIDSPDGGKHKGDTFWAPIAEITDIYPFPANAERRGCERTTDAKLHRTR